MVVSNFHFLPYVLDGIWSVEHVVFIFLIFVTFFDYEIDVDEFWNDERVWGHLVSVLLFSFISRPNFFQFRHLEFRNSSFTTKLILFLTRSQILPCKIFLSNITITHIPIEIPNEYSILKTHCDNLIIISWVKKN